VEIIEKPRFIEKIVEKPVERIIRVPESPDREAYHKARPADDGEDDGRLEQVLIFAKRMFEKKLRPLYYTIWKLLFYIDYLEKTQKQRATAEKTLKAVPPQEDNLVFKDGIISVYHDVRRGITDYLFEIFVRSANHAHQKKVNSLILFIINIKELKEHNLRVFMIALDTFMRIREIVKGYFKKRTKPVGG